MSKNQDESPFFSKPTKCWKSLSTLGDWVWRKRTTKTRSPLPPLFFSTKSSENDVGKWCPTSCVTDDEEQQQRATLSSRRLQISSFCKIYLKMVFVLVYFVSTSVFVYGTSLVILLKYFGADLQRRNDKFQRTKRAPPRDPRIKHG